jgi:hypothetical protein
MLSFIYTCPGKPLNSHVIGFCTTRGKNNLLRISIDQGCDLPEGLFHTFPTVETAEIHLATGFQNAVYEHPAFPADLHAEIEAWCFANAADERKEGMTDSQFVYTTRKKAIGPFKRQVWSLSTKAEILASQAEKLAFLFDQLKVTGTSDLLARYVPNGPEQHRPAPEALKAAAAAS